MKTYEEFRSEIMQSEAYISMTYAQLEDRAAKEYAKQWVERAVKEVADVPPYNMIDYYHKEIDAQ